MKSDQCSLSEKFVECRLTPQETITFEDHLETCDDCRRFLEESAGSEAVWTSVRELLVNRPSEEGPSESVWSNVPVESMTPNETSFNSTVSTVLSILGPTDNPASSGRIGTYEIFGIIGRGGTGIVLKGYDQTLNRNVAIKVLDPALADLGAARIRFLREAKAMAAIAHEHLVAVFEVDEHAGVPYFVMEYIPGGSLERRLRTAGPIDVVSVVRIGLQIAKALTVAHAQGLVHRDIKPGNILLDRGTERVRVVDFGLVRVANEVSCTRSGTISGTPQYMSPEQIRAESCDAQSDLFSLGSVIYTMCTGHPPFRADTVYGMMQRIVHERPRSIRDQNPQIPEWLEQFVNYLMAKDRRHRCKSADEAAAFLERELAHLLNPELTPAPQRHGLARLAGQQTSFLIGSAPTLLICLLCIIISLSLIANQYATGFPSRDRSSKVHLSQIDDLDRSTEMISSGASSNPSNPNPQASVRSGSGLPQLWGYDNTRQVAAQLDEVQTRWSSVSPFEASDLWPAQVQQLQQQILQLSKEMQPPQK